ncbi:alanine racemase [Thiotrichales bacterium 19S11-10]|nr:alanine racemase [Thiotrichales bacterium 19S11-10]MCF6807887.1 alanine racemase [Thiotrichales bacterium 19S9-11]MCF6811901.1 alanine racemase [Thiotrichales bacterium 19S9-12]
MTHYRIEALINKDRLVKNIQALLNKVNPNEVLAMLKANAYGHGAVEVASIINPYVNGFGVASLFEAEKLRESGVDQPIILMSGFVDQDQLPDLKKFNITPVIHSDYQLRWILNYKEPWLINAWLKVNSGMNRLGFSIDDAKNAYHLVKTNKTRFNRCIWLTHLAEAEFPGSDMTINQKQTFDELVQAHPADAISMENSPGLLMDDSLPCDIIRPGAALYGISSFEALAEKTRQYFDYVMTLKSKIIALHSVKEGQTVGYNGIWKAQRDSRIATIPVGYADGYPYNTPQGTPVLIHGKKVPVIGRLSMDMMSVDVTDLDDVSVENEVLLWGDQLPVEEVASFIGVSPYSLVSSLSARVKRTII